MGNLNMSDNSSQTNDSDDLIEQLAKLMAKDAQAEQAAQVESAQSDEISEDESLHDIAITNDDVIAESEKGINISNISNISNSLFEDNDAQPETIEASTLATELDQADISSITDVELNIAKSADPIADLISAQLEEGEEAAVQFEAPSEKIDELNEDLQSPSDDVFSIPPVFGIGSNDAQTKTSSIDENIIEQTQDTIFEQVEVVKTTNTTEIEEIVAPIEITEQVEDLSLAEIEIPDLVEKNAQPSDDPIIDIENLIGEAISAGNITSQNHANIEPSFDGSQDSVDIAASAAESAILAASAEANNENIEETNEAETKQLKQAKKTSFMAGIFGPAVAGAALLAIAFALFWVFSNKTDNSNGTAPTLSADTSAQKIDPPATNDANSQASNSVVFNEISGETQLGNTETLVSRDESATNAQTGSAGAEVTRIISTVNSDESGLANRRVRTVTVRPDGTIVNGDSARAGNEILPVERPNVPQLPADSTIEVPTTATATPISVAVTEAVATPAIAAENITPANIIAPTPFVRPNNLVAPVVNTPATSAPAASNAQAVNLIANNANQAIAPAAPVVTPAAPVLSTTTAPAYVQLSSQREEATARQSMAILGARYDNLLGGAKLEIQRASLADKGIFYRVRLPASSLANANQICANIKQAGGDCFVRTN